MSWHLVAPEFECFQNETISQVRTRDRVFEAQCIDCLRSGDVQCTIAHMIVKSEGCQVDPPKAKEDAKVPPETPRFLQTLITMLEEEDPSIISWGDGGTTIQIKEMNVFSASVLPTYFRHANFPSFQRQLNNYGFRKQPRMKSKYCTYFHPCFIRHLPELLPFILHKRQCLASGRQQIVQLTTRPARGDIARGVCEKAAASSITWSYSEYQDTFKTLEDTLPSIVSSCDLAWLDDCSMPPPPPQPQTSYIKVEEAHV
ncbi:hypothetical protein AeRB84_000418 [Aphanomyces euteiches]|nr:hypothetical protein AeRB84_019242 [Aphanomyces euteiches]KAH9147589.1 hypothetical protein AeRB84_008829 [Aphanomyces euteiches]KAH9148960.1 hypothetical protein AeRB84_007854 [Aphanomyces euteiches]KAH9156027.1 hypothetical protein AeRB84_002013 [Aphanomyces euteiches]KAH9157781.1 hypothetical protein AeRB84_000418 [Aphanomyces euteiches]